MVDIDFYKLSKKGKTVIYKESLKRINKIGWEFWGTRKTEDEEIFVYRKIVTVEEAEQYELDVDILN